MFIIQEYTNICGVRYFILFWLDICPFSHIFIFVGYVQNFCQLYNVSIESNYFN